MVDHFNAQQAVFLKLPHLVEELEFPLQEAIRTAHIARGITPGEFVRGMLLMGGTGTPDRVTLRSGITLDASGDPYRQLDLRTCLKYLCCGGLRVLSEKAGVREYATDQDAFFAFFDIDYRYEEAPERPCGRMLKAGDFSRAMLRLHRMLTEENRDGLYSLFSRRALLRKVQVLMDILQPLCDTSWAYQTQCEAILRTLVQDRLAALDAETEAECCYRKGLACCRSHGVRNMPTGEAMEYFRHASKLGHAQATFLIGICGLEHGVWDYGDEPLYYPLIDAAKQGAKRAELLAAVFEDHYPSEKACNWSDLICFLQNPAGEYTMEKYALGYCYLQRAKYGNDPAKDNKSALHWLELAAGEGSKAAMCLLYELTRKENPASAMAWLKRAATEGSFKAMRMMYLATCGSDPQDAAAWLRKAVEAGDSGAGIALDCLARGKPVCFDTAFQDPGNAELTEAV